MYLEGLQPIWCTIEVQWLVQWFCLFILPSNCGLARGLWAQGTLSSSAPSSCMEQARYCALPSEWLAGEKPQLADRPDNWPAHLCSTPPQSWVEAEIPPTTPGACYPSLDTCLPTGWYCWD